MLDDHLSGAIENNRKLPTLGESFVILDKTGEANEELTKLLKKEWFEDFVDMALDAKFFGFSLIELDDLNEKGELSGVTLVERRCTIPQKRMVTRAPADIVGLSFDDPAYADNYVFCYKKGKLGLLLKCAVNVIYKRYARAAWIDHAENFSLPFLHGKTDMGDAARLAQLTESLENAGRERMAITGHDDEIEAVSLSSTDAFQIYAKLEERCDKGNSKVILGQTMTMDEGSSRSQGEVHERTLEEILQADQRYVTNIVNGQLLPKLSKIGYPFEGCEFKYQPIAQISIDENVKVYEMLLKHYKVDEAEIEKVFGAKVIEKPEPQALESNKPVAAKIEE
jgi:phage gp29-like protein